MLYGLLSVILNSLAQVLIKKSTETSINDVMDILKNPYIYVTGILYIVSIGFWFAALEKLDLSIAYPLQALGYIFVSTAAVIIFHESMAFINIVGVVIIIVGVILTQVGK